MQTVAEYDVLPRRGVAVFAIGLVVAESFLAFALLTGWASSFTAFGATGIVTVFLLAVSINLRRGRRNACGCFGNANEEISVRTLCRIVILLLASLVLAAIEAIARDPVVDMDFLIAIGVSALAYGFEMLSVAIFLVLIVLWILNARELRSVLR